MSRTAFIVLVVLAVSPLVGAALPGAATGAGFWEHHDANSGAAYTCWGFAFVTAVQNFVPYGTLTVTFSFQNRAYSGRVDDCVRDATAILPHTMVWTTARMDADGRITGTHAAPCVTREITLEPGWSGAFHTFRVDQYRPCLGPVTDTFRGVVD